MILFFCCWLRRFFEIDESRLRVRLYPHEGLDLAATIAYWSALTGIPPSQFGKPDRAVAGPLRQAPDLARHAVVTARVRSSPSTTAPARRPDLRA